jgi:hypothetical protein
MRHILQKSLSEECEDLGVDSPSASDLFPEADLLFAASPSSQFDQSQDSAGNNNILSPSHGSTVGPVQLSPVNQILIPRDSRIMNEERGEESEFARMHPNTTFHSGEIEIGDDDPEDVSMGVSGLDLYMRDFLP